MPTRSCSGSGAASGGEPELPGEFSSMSAALEIGVLRRADQAASLFSHPLRLKLLEHLMKPDSASGLARRLGGSAAGAELPSQGGSEAAGLLAVRCRAPACGIERTSGACGGFGVLDQPRSVMGAALRLDPKRLQDRFSWAYLVAAAARIVRDLGVSARPPRPAACPSGWPRSRSRPRCGLRAPLPAMRSLASWPRRLGSLPCGITPNGRRRGVCSDLCWVRTRRLQKPTKRRPQRLPHFQSRSLDHEREEGPFLRKDL